MDSEGLLPHSQETATRTYSEPDQSSPFPLSHFLKIHINTILPSRPGSSKSSLSLRFSYQTPVCISSPYMLQAPPISIFLIWSHE